MIIQKISSTDSSIVCPKKLPKQQAFKGMRKPQELQKVPLKRALFEKFIYRVVKNLKKSKFSSSPEIKKIEQELSLEGINVRFNNDEKLAEYITNGINILKSKGVDIPKNIVFAPSFLLKSGLAVWSKTFPQKEAPIILSKTIYKNTDNTAKLSSDHPNHTFFHETGHWLHFNNNFDPYRNYRIWIKKADTQRIEEVVSKRASELEDGSEFCAEVFSGIMSGKTYPEDIIKLAKELKFPFEF